MPGICSVQLFFLDLNTLKWLMTSIMYVIMNYKLSVLLFCYLWSESLFRTLISYVNRYIRLLICMFATEECYCMSKYYLDLSPSSKRIPIPLFRPKKATDHIFEIFGLKCFKLIESVRSFIQPYYIIPTKGSFRSEL